MTGSRGRGACTGCCAFRDDLKFLSAWELAYGLPQLTAPTTAGRHRLDPVRPAGPLGKVALSEALSEGGQVTAVHLGPPRIVSCPRVVCPSPLFSVPLILLLVENLLMKLSPVTPFRVPDVSPWDPN